MAVPFIAGLQLPQGEDALLGAKVGDHKDLPLTLPADFMQEAYRGKAAAITLDVTGVMIFNGPSPD